MNTKARLFQIANFINFFSIVAFIGIVIYRTNYYRPFNSSDLIPYCILFFIFLIYLVNFYFGLKITSAFFKETSDLKFKSVTRIVFIILEIALLLAYTVLLAYLIPKMTFEQYGSLTFDNIMRIIGQWSLFLGYLGSITRLILTRPMIRSIALKNKHIFDDLGSQTQ